MLPKSRAGGLSAGVLLPALLGLLGLAVWASPAFALGDCAHRGKLDVRYCDENQDLVADLPEDRSKWIDPEVLFFSYSPTEDPAVYINTFQHFLDHLSKVTGKPVRYFPAQSYAAQVEAMRSGRLHVAGISTGPTPFAVNLAGFVPFAIMGNDDGTYGYRMQVIVPAGSPITSVQDLKGRTVAHTEESSNSGNQAPRALLSAMGIVPDKDYKVVYSGGHDRSILGVANKDYQAATVASSVLERMIARGVVDPKLIRIVYETDRFPATAYGVIHDLDPVLALKVQKAFFTYRIKGSPLGKEFKSNAERWIPITYRHHWAVIRTIQEQNRIEYTPGGMK